MVRIVSLVALGLGLLFSNTAKADDDNVQNEINKAVSQLVGLLKDHSADESPNYRGIKTFKDKYGGTIVVTVFTLSGAGGGNGWTDYMAVFQDVPGDGGHSKKYSLLDYMIVGGKGSRGVDRKGIEITPSKDGRRITLFTMKYGPKDGMCCPSVKSNAHFFLGSSAGSRLKEIEKE